MVVLSKGSHGFILAKTQNYLWKYSLLGWNAEIIY